jgi:hypothetical protein
MKRRQRSCEAISIWDARNFRQECSSTCANGLGKLLNVIELPMSSGAMRL